MNVEELRQFISNHLFESVDDFISELVDQFEELRKEDIKLTCQQGKTYFTLTIPDHIISVNVDVWGSEDFCE